MVFEFSFSVLGEQKLLLGVNTNVFLESPQHRDRLFGNMKKRLRDHVPEILQPALSEALVAENFIHHVQRRLAYPIVTAEIFYDGDMGVATEALKMNIFKEGVPS